MELGHAIELQHGRRQKPQFQGLAGEFERPNNPQPVGCSRRCCSSTPYGSRCATKAPSGTRPSIWSWASAPTGTRKRSVVVVQTEGAKFWLRIMNELRNGGVTDILIAVVDGFPEAINVAFPQTPLIRCGHAQQKLPERTGRKLRLEVPRRVSRAPSFSFSIFLRFSYGQAKFVRIGAGRVPLYDNAPVSSIEG